MSSNNSTEIVIRNDTDRWTFITPVLGVQLTDFVKNEIRIKRVQLVSRDKLSRIRKRLGIPIRISDLKKSEFGIAFERILDKSGTFAVVRHSGNISKVTNDCRKIVQDELSILSCSQLGWAKRRSNHKITMKVSKSRPSFEHILLNPTDRRHFSFEVADKLGNLFLDGAWMSFCKDDFFFNLLKVINRKLDVFSSWREDIERAAILIGQSQNSDEIAHAFLWNMIALELLLTEQGDKYTDALPQRISAFLGWFRNWQSGNYPDKIGEVYQKRCAFVHDGRSENITVEDLLFTDDILFNILTNLLSHTKLFKSKKDVIEFSKKVAAEQLLNIKSKVQPKTLRFISRTYNEKDFERM